MSQIALGLFNGSVVLIYGDILYERNPKQRVSYLCSFVLKGLRLIVCLFGLICAKNSFFISHLTRLLPGLAGVKNRRALRCSL